MWKRLRVKNTVTYYGRELSEAVKGFMNKTPIFETTTMETLLKGKDKYNRPPCDN